MYAIVWAYEVYTNCTSAFIEAYSSDGKWAEFFRRGDGFQSTELVRSSTSANRFMTVDRWDSQAAFTSFVEKHHHEYEVLDKLFSEFTYHEERIGTFSDDADVARCITDMNTTFSSHKAMITLHRVNELTPEQQSARQALSVSVYPPGEEWAGRSIEWSPGEWCAICWDTNERHCTALSYVGAVIRSGTLNSNSVKIGGVGGVMTHPSTRRQGLAASAIERIIYFFREQNIDFALLVCELHLVPFYQRLGWQPFTGEMFVTQHGDKCTFTFNLPMVRPICSSAPTTGIIDLMGPPW